MNEKEFFNKLFDRAVAWRFQEGDNIIFEAKPQVIRKWQYKAEGYSPFDLEKGIILTNSKYDSAFSLGWEEHKDYFSDSNDYEHDLTLYYGFWPVMEQHNSITVDYLSDYYNFRKLSTVWHAKNHGVGRFYISSFLQKPTIECFADDREFSGKEIKTWSMSKFLSEEGLGECLDLLKVTGRVVMRDLYRGLIP